MAQNPANQTFNSDFQNNTTLLDSLLKVEQSFDIITRMMNIGGKAAKIYFIDGFLKDEVFERMMEYMAQLSQKDVEQATNAQQFLDKFITYGEAQAMNTVSSTLDLILSGALVLVVEGYDQVIVIDARIYPIRDVKEPDNDKVLRGSRDGFVETLVFNAGLIRRRIRDKELIMKLVQVGNSSKTDVCVCYLDNKVDKELLNDIVSRINSIRVNALTFNQESLAESLVKKQWYNPFPKTRYTERPDAAAANILEGKDVYKRQPLERMLATIKIYRLW